jgi:hypothetical protein
MSAVDTTGLGPMSAGSLAGATEPLPFNVGLVTEDDDLFATVVPGYLDDHAPTIGGTPIDEEVDDAPPKLPISDEGTQILFLKLQVTLTATNNFVWKAVFASLIIDVASALPSDDRAAGTYYKRLATIVDGVKQTPQPVLTNLSYSIADTLDGTSSAVCNW